MSVGQILAEAREERGLSVEDVAASTRIRATLIRQIEADDFSGCGGDVYARGHIRSIARVIGIDPGPALAEFGSAGETDVPVAAVSPAPPITDRAALANSERHRPNWAAAATVALVLIIGVAAYSLVHGGGSPSPSRNAGSHSLLTTPPPTTSSSPATAASPPKGTTALVNTSEASMLVRATSGETWLQVKNAAGATLFENDLQIGQHKLFVSKGALTFIIGNAPAVDIVINGKDIGSPDSTGSVARGRVIPGSHQIQQA